MKSLLGKIIASRIKGGEILGLGSGTTSEAAVSAIGQRIKNESLVVSGIATSCRIAELASAVGIKVLPTTSEVKLSWAFDGADEVDGELNLIKGRGGAMVSEKIVAALAGGLVVLVTEEKLVTKLGQVFPIPVEVIPEAINLVRNQLLLLGAKSAELRLANGVPLTTDHNNHIIDAKFLDISVKLEQQINNIPGVLNNGLFFGLTKEVMVAKTSGVFSLKFSNGALTETLI